jgi:hypothetical protein
MPEHDRPGRRCLGDDALQPTDPGSCQRTESHADLRERRRHRVVVAGRDAHHPCRFGSAKPERKRCAERNRHLAEELSCLASTDDRGDPVDEPDRLQPPLEHRKQRPLVTLMHRVLTRHEHDVRRVAGKAIALRRPEPCEDRDAGDVLGGQQRCLPSCVTRRSYGRRDCTSRRSKGRVEVRPSERGTSNLRPMRCDGRRRTLGEWNNVLADSMTQSARWRGQGHFAA